MRGLQINEKGHSPGKKTKGKKAKDSKKVMD
jgi:hypothetical protein